MTTSADAGDNRYFVQSLKYRQPRLWAKENRVGFEIDTSTTFGAAVIERLEAQKLAWLTTVDSRGTPQPNPVWFIWDGGVIYIFSKPNQAKLSNIARSGHIAFNLEATADEEHVTILTGQAEIIARTDLPADILDRYAERYTAGMKGIQMTRAEYEAAYTIPIRFTPEKLRGW
jgi:PPOX class probable F420-dependent enzyme